VLEITNQVGKKIITNQVGKKIKMKGTGVLTLSATSACMHA